jgi:hypothetical protein
MVDRFNRHLNHRRSKDMTSQRPYGRSVKAFPYLELSSIRYVEFNLVYTILSQIPVVLLVNQESAVDCAGHAL